MRETRAEKILSAAAKCPELAELAIEAVRDGRSESDFLRDGLALLASQRGGPRVEVGKCWDTKWRDTASDYLCWRACSGRIPGKLSASERARREAAAVEFSAEICENSGVLVSIARRLNRGRFPDNEIQIRALQMGSSDFPAVTLDAINKSLHGFFAEMPQTWRPISRIRNAPDFKTLNSVGLQGASAFVETPEGVPVSEGAAVDVRSQYAIKTYSRSFGIGRQTLINDDLNAFGSLAAEAARGAAVTISDLVFSLVQSSSGTGPVMAEDSKALFAVDHPSGANYITSTGAPDAAGLGALMKLMRLQKGLVAAGETAPYLGLRPSILLVPAALAETAAQTLSASTSFDSGGDPAFEQNLRLLVEPRLDAGANGSVAWYLVASPIICPGIEVAALDGRVEPSTRMFETVSPLGLSFVSTLDVGVKAIEHRGWARTKGA